MDSKRDHATALKLLPLLGVVVLLSVFVGVERYNDKQPDSDYCLPDDGKSRHTVFLIDKSDNFTARQYGAVEKIIDDTVSDLKYQERLSVFFIQGELPTKKGAVGKAIPEPDTFFCKPAASVDEYSTGGFMHGKVPTEIKYAEFEQKKIDTLKTHLKDETPSIESPILETAWEAVSDYKKFSPQTSNRRLIIISDLVEHSMPDFNSCADDYPYNFNEFQKTEFYRRYKLDLKNVQVSVYYLKHDASNADHCAYKTQQNGNLEGFWKSIFKDAGATLEHDPFRIIKE